MSLEESRRKAETMKLYDDIRVDMVRRRERPEIINAVSRMYLRVRGELEADARDAAGK